MDHAEMAQRLALAAYGLVQLGEVAMRRERERIAFDRAHETPERVLQLVAAAVEQPQADVDVGVGGNNRRGAEQRAQRAGEVALTFEQAREIDMRVKIARLAPEQ